MVLIEVGTGVDVSVGVGGSDGAAGTGRYMAAHRTQYDPAGPSPIEIENGLLALLEILLHLFPKQLG